MHIGAVVFILLLCLGLSLQQCSDTYPYTTNRTVHRKVNAPHTLRLGVIGGYSRAELLPVYALAHEINNDMSILPEVAIELYSSITPPFSQSDMLLATLFHCRNLNIQGLIGGFYSAESKIAQIVAKVYSVPQLSGSSIGYSLSNKIDYPYFVRIAPADAIQIDGMVQLYRTMNWTRGLLIYTDDEYGMGYSRLIAQAQAAGINMIPISVPATASNRSDVQSTVNHIISTLQSTKYKTLLFYTQHNPATLIRAALNESGYFGPDYVYILSVTSVQQFVFSNTENPLNDGVIGFASGAPQAPVYEEIYAKWANSPDNPWAAPPIASIPLFGWYDVDVLYSFVNAVESLMNSGMNYTDIKGQDLLKTILAQNFTGATGPTAFEGHDRMGSYDIYSMRTVGATKVGTYSSVTDQLTLTGNFVFTGGRTSVPLDGPFACEFCDHGTCKENVGCVCDKGWAGKYCSTDLTPTPLWPVGLAVAVIVVLIVGAAFGAYTYRKKRNQLVKQVAEKQRSNINRTDITFGNRVGRGASGEVFKAQFRGTEVAVKKIIATNADSKVIQDFEMEVAIMCALRHPNIVLFMGSCFDTATKEMLLVMEYMTKGSLHDVLHNPKIELSYDMKLHLAAQAAQGMNFLHQSSPPILHRDLKSHNILLDDKWNSKISDFGITQFKKIGKEKDHVQTRSFGTIFWTAPEALSGAESTEKCDVYSFGIILWEIFHRENPYVGRDPVSVAIDVIANNLRPTISAEVSNDVKALINSCWNSDPELRPSFQDIMATLRSLSLKNPMGADGAVAAPTGLVYMVNTQIVDVLDLWETDPVRMYLAVNMHNALVREKARNYRGYEALYDYAAHSFLFVFTRVDDALNFCIDSQLELKTISWPEELLRLPRCATVRSNVGTVLHRGLRSRMSVFGGVPNCALDSTTGRMTYIGSVVEKSRKILSSEREGNILISDTVNAALSKHQVTLVKHASTQRCSGWTVAGEDSVGFHQLIISGYERSISPLVELSENHPHIIDIDLIDSNISKSDVSKASWIATLDEIDIKESVGKGATGDYHKVMWHKKELVFKQLINQKLKENDILKFISDAAYMSKLSHSNILPYYAVCLDADSLGLLCEYMPGGSLKDMLADSEVPLSMSRRMNIALDIAHGMQYLDSCVDYEEIRRHDNLKSSNILIGKDGEVKIADYGQGNIKDLARTMTSISSSAWTAPEILAGEEQITTKIATYAFGIILWELYTRDVPYASEHPIRVVTKILTGYRPQIPSSCPTELFQLIMDCQHADPKMRPSWDHIIISLFNILPQVQ